MTEEEKMKNQTYLEQTMELRRKSDRDRTTLSDIVEELFEIRRNISYLRKLPLSSETAKSAGQELKLAEEKIKERIHAVIDEM